MQSLLEDAFDSIVRGRAPLAFMATDEAPLESVKGISNARVETINSGIILPGFLEAHEQRCLAHHKLAWCSPLPCGNEASTSRINKISWTFTVLKDF